MSQTHGEAPNPNRCLDCMTPAALESLAVIASDKHSIHDLSGIGICGKTGEVTEVWDIQHLLLQRWASIRETGRAPEKYEPLRFHMRTAPGAVAETQHVAGLSGAA